MKAFIFAMGSLAGLATLALLGLGSLQAAELPASMPGCGRTGNWPSKPALVTIDDDDISVHEALQAIAQQAGWSLVVRAGELEETICVHLTKVPATDALDVVLEGEPLEAHLSNKTLVVRDVDAPASAPSVLSHHKRLHGKKNHGKDRVSTGGNLHVATGEEADDAVAVGGNVTVDGHCTGDAVSIGGSVNVEPGAVVDGDAVSIGGSVHVQPGGVVHGNRTSVGGIIGSILEELPIHVGSDSSSSSSEADKPSPVPKMGERITERISSVFERALAGFVLGALFVIFVPQRVTRVRELLNQDPTRSFVAGLALVLGLLPFCILLCVTVVGILLVPVALALSVVVFVMGYVALLMWIGDRLPILTERRTPLLTLCLGVGVITLVDFVPYFGTLLVVLASILAAGAVVLTRFGNEPKVPVV